MKITALKFVTLGLGLFCLSLFATTANAQVQAGVKAGLSIRTNTAKDVFNGQNTGTFQQNLQDANIGLHGGLFARIGLGFLFIQPEVTVSTLKDLDIPILIGTKLGPLRLNAGPMARMALDRNVNNTDSNQDINLRQSTTFGFQAGGGIDIGKFGLDMRYESNLTGLGEEFKIFGRNHSTNSGAPQFVVSASMRF